MRVVLDQRERPSPRPADQLQVVGEARQLEVGHARLLRVEQRSLTAEPEVFVGQLEPVGGANHRLDARPRLLVLRVGLVEQDAVAPVRSAADPAAELVQLGQAEPLGVLHEHHGRVRDVDPDLDDGRRDQQVGRARRGSRSITASFSFGRIRPWSSSTRGRGRPRSPGARPRPPPPSPAIGSPRRSPRTPRTPAGRPRPRRAPGRTPRSRSSGVRTARVSIGWRPFGISSSTIDVEVAVVRERQRPRDRRRGHDQHVRLRALALQRHPLMQTEPMLLVDRPRATGRGTPRPPGPARACPTTRSTAPSAIPCTMRARSLPVTAPVRSA